MREDCVSRDLVSDEFLELQCSTVEKPHLREEAPVRMWSRKQMVDLMGQEVPEFSPVIFWWSRIKLDVSELLLDSRSGRSINLK